MKIRATCAIVCIMSAGCDVATSHRQHVSDSIAVHDVATGIIEADNARALDRVMEYYDPDAILLPPNERPIGGLEEIRPRYETLFRSYDPAIEAEIDEVGVAGDLAYVRGRNRGFLRGREGTEDRALNDVYIMIVERAADGPWLISRLIWHADGQSGSSDR